MTDCYATDTWKGFLAAIRADPANDLPRLTAADYLDDCGESIRAEMIRVGVAAAQGGERAVMQPVFDREYDLLREHWRDWVPVGSGYKTDRAADVMILDYFHPAVSFRYRRFNYDRDVTGADRCVIHWSRGFASEVECECDWWVRFGDALLAREPAESVTLTSVDVDRFTAAEWGAAIRATNVTADEYAGGDPVPDHPVHRALFERRWPGVRFVLPANDWAAQRQRQIDAITRMGGLISRRSAIEEFGMPDVLGGVAVAAGRGGVTFRAGGHTPGDDDGDR